MECENSTLKPLAGILLYVGFSSYAIKSRAKNNLVSKRYLWLGEEFDRIILRPVSNVYKHHMICTIVHNLFVGIFGFTSSR